MKLIDEVDAQKLRGGYYTPDWVVDACYEIISPLVKHKKSLRLLEPSAGNGAFVRGVSRSQAIVRCAVATA